MARLAAWKLGGGSTALVIGKTIHLHKTRREEFLADEKWFRHEMAHIRQFRRYGFLRFLFLYLIESIRHGYHNNRFEVEARKAEEEAGG